VEEFCVGLRDRGIMTSFLFSMLADIFESKGQHAQAAEVSLSIKFLVLS